MDLIGAAALMPPIESPAETDQALCGRSAMLATLSDMMRLVRLFEAIASGDQANPHCTPDQAGALLDDLRRSRDQLIHCAFDATGRMAA